MRVWHPCAPADIWHGEHGSAPVVAGDVAYQWNNGDVCA